MNTVSTLPVPAYLFALTLSMALLANGTNKLMFDGKLKNTAFDRSNEARAYVIIALVLIVSSSVLRSLAGIDVTAGAEFFAAITLGHVVGNFAAWIRRERIRRQWGHVSPFTS